MGPAKRGTLVQTTEAPRGLCLILIPTGTSDGRLRTAPTILVLADDASRYLDVARLKIKRIRQPIVFSGFFHLSKKETRGNYVNFFMYEYLINSSYFLFYSSGPPPTYHDSRRGSGALSLPDQLQAAVRIP